MKQVNTADLIEKGNKVFNTRMGYIEIAIPTSMDGEILWI